MAGELPELLLWLDTETTSVDPATTSVLECAWSVTLNEPPNRENLHDWQLTPLRSRLCRIKPAVDASLTPRQPGVAWFIEDAGADWVRRTHTASGLVADLQAAHAGQRLIQDAAILDRLIVDDLNVATTQWRARHGAAADTAPVIRIAGDGVGHFDQRIITRGTRGGVVTPQFPLTAPRLHYRPEDVSHAVHVLARIAYGRPLDGPMRFLHGHNDPVRDDAARMVSAALAVDPNIDPPAMGEVTRWLDPHVQDVHRAAADVVRSMLSWTVALVRVGDALSCTPGTV